VRFAGKQLAAASLHPVTRVPADTTIIVLVGSSPWGHIRTGNPATGPRMDLSTAFGW